MAKAPAVDHGADLSEAPERPAWVLAALILAAGVANLSLAVANVALPTIGSSFDAVAGRTQPDRGGL